MNQTAEARPPVHVSVDVVLLTLIAVGTIGFYLIGGERANLSDAVYMTLITITTVGYGDVVPHGDGRLIGSIEAVIGTLMTGLSTAWLLAFVSRALVSKSPA